MNAELELKAMIEGLISQYNIKHYAVQRSMYFAGVEVRMYSNDIRWYAEGHFSVNDFLNNKEKVIKDLEDLHKLYLMGPENAQ
jgi:hypothetical protein